MEIIILVLRIYNFPEVNFDKVEKIRGLDITVVIKSQNVDHNSNF